MTVLDNLLRSDICSFEDCGEEAFRNCVAGCGWRCPEHACQHMESDNVGSWLSTEAVVARMNDSELAATRVRLALQLQAVSNEMDRRQRQAEFSRGVFHPKFRPKKPKNEVHTTQSLLAKFLDSLTPQQLTDLERKLRKEKEDELKRQAFGKQSGSANS